LEKPKCLKTDTGNVQKIKKKAPAFPNGGAVKQQQFHDFRIKKGILSLQR
jgi:hypothetical protein